MREGAQVSATRRRRLPGGCLAALAFMLALVVVLSCGALSVTGHDPRLLWYQAQTVDTLDVSYTQFSADRTLPLPEQRVTDAITVQALYNAAFALPAVDIFAHENCALGPPIAYHLAFARGKVVVAIVDVDLSGCGYVSLAGIATRQVTGPFEQMMASALHESVVKLEQPITYPPASPYPMMMLTIHRISQTPTTPFTPLSVVITDPAVVFALDNEIAQDSAYGGQQLPPSGACPPNDSILYRLSFYQDGVNFAVKDVEATGCQLIYTHDGFPPEYISVPVFWDALASALGVTRASLGVGPQPLYWTTPSLVPHQR